MRLYVANVGANMADAGSRGLRSPVFPDGTFELVPIKEAASFAGADGIPRYNELPSWTHRYSDLGEVLPARIRGYRAHADPEFDTFTYGDVTSPRASALRRIAQGDSLWFLARLWGHDGGRWTGRSGFYFVGQLSGEQYRLRWGEQHGRSLTAPLGERPRAAFAGRIRRAVSGDRRVGRVGALHARHRGDPWRRRSPIRWHLRRGHRALHRWWADPHEPQWRTSPVRTVREHHAHDPVLSGRYAARGRPASAGAVRLGAGCWQGGDDAILGVTVIGVRLGSCAGGCRGSRPKRVRHPRRARPEARYPARPDACPKKCGQRPGPPARTRPRRACRCPSWRPNGPGAEASRGCRVPGR